MNTSRDFRPTLIVLTLLVAIIAFEIFNYDTTRFALSNLLGTTAFMGMRWASILAIAFCGIDFAGLLQIFSVDENSKIDKAQMYLFGAWLTGATLNAVMTWYAVSLTLLNHPIGNEILTREQLLRWMPVFVAALVWITRILFIGALTLMGDVLRSVLVWPRMRTRSANHSDSSMSRSRAHLREVPLRPRMNGQPEEMELRFSNHEELEC